jgi:hypothetical protein
MAERSAAFNLPQLISLIHLARRQVLSGSNDASTVSEEEETAQIVSWVLHAEANYENYEQLDIVKTLKGVVMGRIQLDPEWQRVSSANGEGCFDDCVTRTATACQPAYSELLRQLASETSSVIDTSSCSKSGGSTEMLLQYSAGALPNAPTTGRCGTGGGGGYFSFNFDDMPLLTPIDPLLQALKKNPFDITALEALLTKDADDYFEHPQWYDIISIIKHGLIATSEYTKPDISAKSSPEMQGCQLCLLLHIHLIKNLPEIQAVDVMENVIESLCSIWIHTSGGASSSVSPHRDEPVITEYFYPSAGGNNMNNMLTRTRLVLVLLMMHELPEKLILSDMKRSDGIILALCHLLHSARVPVKRMTSSMVVDCVPTDGSLLGSGVFALPLLELLIAGSANNAMRSCDGDAVSLLQQFMKRLLHAWPAYSILNHLVHSGLLSAIHLSLAEAVQQLQRLQQDGCDDRYYWVGMDPLTLAVKRVCVFTSILASIHQAFSRSISGRLDRSVDKPIFRKLLDGPGVDHDTFMSAQLKASTGNSSMQPQHSFPAGAGVAAVKAQQQANQFSHSGNILIPVKEVAGSNKRCFICSDCEPIPLSSALKASDEPDRKSSEATEPCAALLYAVQLLVRRQGNYEANTVSDSSGLRVIVQRAIADCFEALPWQQLALSVILSDSGICSAVLEDGDNTSVVSEVLSRLDAALASMTVQPDVPRSSEEVNGMVCQEVGCVECVSAFTQVITSIFSAANNDHVCSRRILKPIAGIIHHLKRLKYFCFYRRNQDQAQITQGLWLILRQCVRVFGSSTENDSGSSEIHLLEARYLLLTTILSDISVLAVLLDTPPSDASEVLRMASNLLTRLLEMKEDIDASAFVDINVVVDALVGSIIAQYWGRSHIDENDDVVCKIVTTAATAVDRCLCIPDIDAFLTSQVEPARVVRAMTQLFVGLVQLGYAKPVLRHLLQTEDVAQLTAIMFERRCNANEEGGTESFTSLSGQMESIIDIILVHALENDEFRQEVIAHLSKLPRNCGAVTDMILSSPASPATMSNEELEQQENALVGVTQHHDGESRFVAVLTTLCNNMDKVLLQDQPNQGASPMIVQSPLRNAESSSPSLAHKRPRTTLSTTGDTIGDQEGKMPLFGMIHRVVHKVVAFERNNKAQSLQTLKAAGISPETTAAAMLLQLSRSRKYLLLLSTQDVDAIAGLYEHSSAELMYVDIVAAVLIIMAAAVATSIKGFVCVSSIELLFIELLSGNAGGNQFGDSVVAICKELKLIQ